MDFPYPGNGNVAGLLYPFFPTALTPKIALSLASKTVALLTRPTGITFVQNVSSVARHTISYPATAWLLSMSQLSVLLFVSTNVSIVTFFGVPGACANDQIAAPLTFPTLVMKSKSQNSMRSPNCFPVTGSTRTSWC